MVLQRFQPGLEWPKYLEDGPNPSAIMEPDDGEWCDAGKWYRAGDVDDLLTRIRSAVVSERDARDEAAAFRSPLAWERRDAAIAALDALLSQEATDG